MALSTMRLTLALCCLWVSSVHAVNEAQMTALFGSDRKAAGNEGTGADRDDSSDFFDEIDPTGLGRKDCTNQQEVTDCVADCEADKDCTQVSQESLCEQDCLVICKYLDYWNRRKCVNHMVAHVSWYRGFGGATAGKLKVKPRKNSRGGLAGPSGDDARAPTIGEDRSGAMNRAPPVVMSRAPPINMG